MRRLKTALVLVVVGMGAVALRCSSPQQEVKKAVLKLAAAVEDKDLLALAEGIASDYSDRYGNDRSGVLASMRMVFQQYESIVVLVEASEPQIDEAGQNGSVACKVAVRAKTPTGEIGEDSLRATLKLRKEGRRWLLTEGQVDPVP